MCLAEISPVKPKPNGFGYKVLKVDGDKLRSACMNTINPWHTWIKASPSISSGNQVGFHIYRTREKAEQCIRWYDDLYFKHSPSSRPNYRVFKVQYRKATLQGIGDGGFTKNPRVIIAQEMYIL
jgi:hypothetical protein